MTTAELLHQLIAIPSVNPAYDPESLAEAAISDFIEAWANERGFDVERQPVFAGRDNLRITFAEQQADLPVLLFEAHMDTVGISEGTRAGFVPVIDDGRMYGRGACDTKGSLAAMMRAFEQLSQRQSELSCNPVLLAAVDEETVGGGSLHFAKSVPNVHAAVVGEPTSCRIVHAHKGVVRGKIRVHGKAAHTSVAREGANAIDAMADVIVQLRSISDRLSADPEGGTLTVSLIEGGTGINIVPELCTVAYDRRTVPGDSTSAVLKEINEVLDALQATRQNVRIEHVEPPDLAAAPLNTPVDHALVKVARESAQATGMPDEPEMVPYGSDACYLSEIAGIPCLVFGPGAIEQAHSAEEYVELSEVDQAVSFLTELGVRYRG